MTMSMPPASRGWVRTSIRRSAAVVSAALLASASVLAPASAATTTVHDKAPHLTTVVLTHGPANVKVKADVGPMAIGSYFTFWFDTAPKNAGPEYKVTLYPNSEIGERPVIRVGSFNDKGKGTTCDGLRGTADVYGSEFVTLKVPRSCLGTPAKVRVAVRGYYAVPGPNVIDWAPAYRTFSSWVATG